MLNITKTLTKEELTEKYKDRGELTVEFILFAYEHYGDLLDFSDTYVEDQNKETILDIKDYCRIKVVPKSFIKSLGNKIIERAINFVENLTEKRKDLSIIPKKTVYINNNTKICLLCSIHKKEVFGSPSNILRGRRICKECSDESRRLANKRNSLIFCQNRLNEKYGVGRFTVLIEESINHIKDKITFIRCNKCNSLLKLPYTTLSHYIAETMGSDLCPTCDKQEKDQKRLKHFVDRFTAINESRDIKLDLDFSNSYVETIKRGEKYDAKIFNIKCNKCGLYFDIMAGNLMYVVNCPHCGARSNGETIIGTWLRKNNIEFEEQIMLKNGEIKELGHPVGLFIDFSLTIEDRVYWIEYNGEQHYNYCPHFKDDINDFFSQLKRDEYVYEYCKRNNITLIELPWTLKSTEIIAILEDILINNIPHPYEFPNIRLIRKKEFPDTGLHRSEFLKQNNI